MLYSYFIIRNCNRTGFEINTASLFKWLSVDSHGFFFKEWISGNTNIIVNDQILHMFGDKMLIVFRIIKNVIDIKMIQDTNLSYLLNNNMITTRYTERAINS